MNNSLVHSLEGYVESVFRDLQPTYSSVSDWERDLKRSLHELAIRGERFLTVDLPAIRKHLERCLDEGLYYSNNIYLSRLVSKRVLVPAYLRDLYLQIFDTSGKLRCEPNVCAIADLRQLLEGLGKLKLLCKQEVIDDEVKTFATNENELRTPSLNWTGDDLYQFDTGVSRVRFEDVLSSDRPDEQLDAERVKTLTKAECRTLEKVCDILSTQLGDFHNESTYSSNKDQCNDHLEARPQHGHGRVSDLARNESKYSFRTWPAKLDRIFPYDRYGQTDYGLSGCLMGSDTIELEYPRDAEFPSKLIAVPKTASGPRLIASEPSAHQWIQQLVRKQVESSIPRTSFRHCISFGDQRPNRLLALRSSADGTLSTVDLRSASDRLSCWAVERIFRANVTLLERLHACRTRTMVNRVTETHFKSIVLKKCFTQGSACTFPVQTVAYACMAIASVLITEGQTKVTSASITRASKLVRVFGDDVICPTNALEKLIEIFEFLQLKVNLSKTFSKGRFRESCGLDAYNGVNVTPARIKRFSTNPSHEVADSMLESSNNLFKRGMWHTAIWLQSHLGKFAFQVNAIRTSPEGDELLHDSDGLASFLGNNQSHLRRRWNQRFQRWERRVSRKDVKVKVVSIQGAYDLKQYLFASHGVPGNLGYLHPKPAIGLGVVVKQSSVMKTGWVVERS